MLETSAFSQEAYLTAWGFYLLGCLGMMVIVFALTRGFPYRTLRHSLRLLALVLLVTPYYVETDQGFLAPALIMSLIEGVFDGVDAMWRAGMPLVIAVASTLLLYLLGVIFWWRRRWKEAQLDQEMEAYEGDRQAMLRESQRISG